MLPVSPSARERHHVGVPYRACALALDAPRLPDALKVGGWALGAVTGNARGDAIYAIALTEMNLPRPASRPIFSTLYSISPCPLSTYSYTLQRRAKPSSYGSVVWGHASANEAEARGYSWAAIAMSPVWLGAQYQVRRSCSAFVPRDDARQDNTTMDNDRRNPLLRERKHPKR